MTAISYVGQAHETFDGVKLVKWDSNSPPTIGQRKNQRKQNRRTIKLKHNITQSDVP